MKARLVYDDNSGWGCCGILVFVVILVIILSRG